MQPITLKKPGLPVMAAVAENMMAEGTVRLPIIKMALSGIIASVQDVSYRTYGEFADDYKPNIPVLKDHFCPYYTGWDQKVRDTTRLNQWKRDFDSLLA